MPKPKRHLLATMLRLLTAMPCLLTTPMTARNVVYDPQVKSLQAVVNNDWLSPAVMRLGTDDVLHIGFDELSHQYNRYIYKVEHCEADWSPSEELFESNWMEGFNNNPIDTYEHSVNTTFAYTHYSLDIPNSMMRLKMSGNYRLHIYKNGDEEQEVATVDFRVTEQSMPLTLTATTNTDIDTNLSHQQVSVALVHQGFRIVNPEEQIMLVVMQNGREDNLRQNLKPTIIGPGMMEWTHHKGLIFDAGNEYHKFEILDVSHPTMGIETIHWDNDERVFEAAPFINEPRPHYLYDEDADGAFYIRNSDNWENNTTSDYVWVNYRLRSPQLPEGSIVIDGQWTTDSEPRNYEMTYDDAQQLYTARLLQKQGYYSYQYLWRHADGTTGILPSEGSFYQTENRYQAFVYFRGIGDSTWRLTAYLQMELKSQ